ncbi:MAG: sulfoxide reductase heme-binding subunit YedZ [Oscillochloris sp.]|nr:sulfoxide reductase heme-binding subunit YedZ [Oscillochloris sp.]
MGGVVAERCAAGWLRIVLHLGCLAPLVLLLRDLATVNPIQAITQHSGRTALIILMLSLACTPLRLIFGWRWAASLRRALGLYSFFYACLHLLVFLLDYGFAWGMIAQTITEKRYILAGLAGFGLLLPLAISSTKGWQRRLGRRWRLLHRLVYPAALLAVLHFLWLSKVARDPLIYGAIVLLLLALRLPPLRIHLGRRKANE